jgi:hypothetical protein
LPDVTELGNEAIAQYVEAGKVAAKVKRAIRPKIKPGVSVLEICKSVEDDIMSCGANPAFPCNLCINDIAAHYTALPCDVRIKRTPGMTPTMMPIMIWIGFEATCRASAYLPCSMAPRIFGFQTVKAIKTPTAPMANSTIPIMIAPPRK